jgi:hypothetical protein
MEQIESDELVASFFQFKHSKEFKVKDATCLSTCSKYNLTILGTLKGLDFVQKSDFQLDLNTKITTISTGDLTICADQESVFQVDLVKRCVGQKTPLKNVKEIQTNPGFYPDISAILTNDCVYILSSTGLKPLEGTNPTSSIKD